MALVLFTFSDSLFISNHSVMLFNSVFIASIFVFLFSVLHNVVSSAYIIKSNLLLECAISLIYIIKSSDTTVIILFVMAVSEDGLNCSLSP